MSNSLQPHGLQHARPPCPSATPRACSNSWPWSWWCHPTISSCFPLLLLPSIFPSIRIFSNESALLIRWPEYWSFSISPSWIFKIDFLQDRLVWSLCCSRDSQKSFLALQFKSINSLAFSFLYTPTLTSVYDYWKNHSFDHMDLCQQSDVFAF